MLFKKSGLFLFSVLPFSFLNLPSIVVVIRVFIFDKQPKRNLSHTHTHTHAHTCPQTCNHTLTLYHKAKINIFIDLDMRFFRTFLSWLQLLSVCYFVKHAVKEFSNTCTHTHRLLTHTLVQCKIAWSLHTVKPRDNPSWIMESHMSIRRGLGCTIMQHKLHRTVSRARDCEDVSSWMIFSSETM